MTPEQWAAAEALFHELSAASADRRERRLVEAARRDPEVAEAVSGLLAEDSRGEGLLEAGPARGLESVLADLAEEAPPAEAPEGSEPEGPDDAAGGLGPGARLGAWALVERLGSGGMGEVWLAERADGAFAQRVAIKLLKRGMDSEQVVARFQREREILARLSHPGIARLLDAGTAPDGRPYLVMERVEGRQVTEHCVAERLAVDDRLRLFLEVCDAVEAAHRSLVVHRDLKPSNILVAADGEVKLLDFGIAKLLEEEPGSEATRTGLRLLTPSHAAPEQILGEPATTATDVYGLGVVLYELLTGRLPHRRQAASPAGLAAEVEHETVERPSAAVHRAAAEEAVASRAVEPARLARRLVGDLDVIALKALASDPERRYGSAADLAEDVRRHLAGQTIRARPDTVGYRTRKFLRRHLLGTAAATVTLLALLLGLAGTLWQGIEARRERDRARLEAAKLAAAREYLVSLFEAADPAEALGREVTAQQLVDRGVEGLRELTDQPEVESEMLETLARVSLALGDYPRAEALLERRLEGARERHGPEDTEFAHLLVGLARVHEGSGDWDRAAGELRSALDLYRRLGASESEGAVEALGLLGTVLYRQGDPEAAASTLRKAVSLSRGAFGERSHEVALALHDYASPLQQLGLYDAAEGALRESLDIYREHFGYEHPDIATTMVDLGGVLRSRGNLAAAEPLYRQGVAMDRRLHGDDHPRFAIKMHNLAVLLHDLGHYAEAARVHRQVLETVRERMGTEHPYYGATLDSLASDLAQAGELEEARALFAQAEPALRRAFGTEHSTYVVHLRRRGMALYCGGLASEAIPLLDQAIEANRSLRGVEHPATAATLADRGRVRLVLGDIQGADEDLREALRIQRLHLPAGHFVTAATLTGLAWALWYRELPEKAEPLAREAMEIADATLPKDDWRRFEARSVLGATVARDRREEGVSMLREAQAALAASRGEDHPDARRATDALKSLSRVE